MNKSFRRRWLFALMGVLVAWWLFTLGYYLENTQTNKLSIASLTSEIKFKKYLVNELRKGNTESVIEKLQDMAELNEAQIKMDRQALDELTVFSFAVHPYMTISGLLLE